MVASWNYVCLNDSEAQVGEEPARQTERFPRIIQSPPGGHIISSTSNLNTAVRPQHVEAAATMDDSDMQAADMVLLDAISAWKRHDYRTALLYAAIAAESMIEVELDTAYQALCERGDPDGVFRLTDIPQAGGKTMRKDHIYAYLANRDDFKLLIGARALYVLRRSPLTHNENLYRTALKLYNTRNRIAHHGDVEITQKADLFSLTQQSSLEGLECAIDLFEWYRGHTGLRSPREGELTTSYRLEPEQ